MTRWSMRRIFRRIVLISLFVIVGFAGLSLSGFVLVISANWKTEFVMDAAPRRLPMHKLGPLSFGFVAHGFLGTDSTGILLGRCADQRMITLAYFSNAPERVFQWVPDVCRAGFRPKPNQSNI